MGPLKIENLKKPPNKKWKLIADYLLYTAMPALIIFFTTVQPVSLEFSLYGTAVITLLVTLFKGATKFTAEPEI